MKACGFVQQTNREKEKETSDFQPPASSQSWLIWHFEAKIHRHSSRESPTSAFFRQHKPLIVSGSAVGKFHWVAWYMTNAALGVPADSWTLARPRKLWSRGNVSPLSLGSRWPYDIRSCSCPCHANHVIRASILVLSKELD